MRRRRRNGSLRMKRGFWTEPAGRAAAAGASRQVAIGVRRAAASVGLAQQRSGGSSSTRRVGGKQSSVAIRRTPKKIGLLPHFIGIANLRTFHQGWRGQ